MELVVFDLDGTLLNRRAAISPFTSETLKLLSTRNIAYTVATGRTLHASREVLEGHRFDLPQAYKNGVMIWHPEQARFSNEAMLTAGELCNVVRACLDVGVTPFVFTLDDDYNTAVYHPPLQSRIERDLIRTLNVRGYSSVHDYDQLPPGATITHINSIGDRKRIQSVLRAVDNEPHLVAYSGVSFEGKQWRWLDVHHSDASKGGAIEAIRKLLPVTRVICFGDNDNDLSMFEAADESYAPANATDAIRSAATAVIGHHDEDGIAQFLRERFAL